MKRITVSLDDELYRIAKAYAQSEDISLSKAIVRMLRRVTHAARLTPGTGRSGAEDLGPNRYRDPLTGIVVSRGKPDAEIPAEAATRDEQAEDLQHWNPGQ